MSLPAAAPRRTPDDETNLSAGVAAQGFAPVRAVFEAVLRSRPGFGAGLCVYVDGQPVVDLWGGTYRSNTLQVLFSATKGVTAVCAAILAQRGLLDLDAPVAALWPEFAANGKGAITPRMVLSHSAGLPAADAPLSMFDHRSGGPAVDILAAQAPIWVPGTAHGYHGITYGTLMGEIVLRATGRTVGQVLADEVAVPLGLDLWIGLPEHIEPRVAPARSGPSSASLVVAAAADARHDPSTVAARVSFASLDTGEFNQRALHEAELPAAGGIGSPRSLARMYAACMGAVDGVRLLDDATLASACEVQADGRDEVSVEENRFGLGFYLPFARLPMAGPTSFGHDGAGGALAFGDRASRMAFAFTTDLVPALLGADPDVDVLVAAVMGCLA